MGIIRRYLDRFTEDEKFRRLLLLESILIDLEGKTVGKREAAQIVGGNKRLETLIASGEIHAEKGKNVQNSKWQCNAAQVYRHCRNLRKTFINTID